MADDAGRSKYRFVIALGKNWDSEQNRLSIESRMTALAAGKLLEDGVVDRVIFSGGHTAGSDMPSEGQAMLDHMGLVYKDQVHKASVEGESLDTSRNAEYVRDSIEPDKKSLLLSVGYHVPRATRIFDGYGIETDPMSSESVLADERGSMDRFLENYSRSNRHRFEVAKEGILRMINLVDRKGIMLRGLATVLRSGK